MSNLIIRLCKAAKDTDGPLGDLLLEAAECIIGSSSKEMGGAAGPLSNEVWNRLMQIAAGSQLAAGIGGAQTDAPPVWQYFLRPDMCISDPPEGECWHDEGTGPFFSVSRNTRVGSGLSWRPKPPASGAEPQSTTAAQTAALKAPRCG